MGYGATSGTNAKVNSYVAAGQLQVAKVLYDFIQQGALPNSGVDEQHFWEGFSQIVRDFAPRNRELLKQRERLQEQINEWHRQNRDSFDFERYKAFL